MIFLSHNWKDKDVVEPIAVRLKDVYGEENVFYDSWSIKPGENIIGKYAEKLVEEVGKKYDNENNVRIDNDNLKMYFIPKDDTKRYSSIYGNGGINIKVEWQTASDSENREYLNKVSYKNFILSYFKSKFFIV